MSVPAAPSDPFPVVLLLQAHLEALAGRGQTRLHLTTEAAEALREIVRMKPRPRPPGESAKIAVAAPPAVVAPTPAVVPEAAPAVIAPPEPAPPAAVQPTPALVEVEVVVPVVSKIEIAEPPPPPPPPARALAPMTRSEKEAALASVRARAELGDKPRALGTLRDTMVFAVGNPEAEIMLVGEAPGADEERQGEPFVGPAGQLLTRILKAMGLEREDVYISNICKYRPAMENQRTGNRQPTAAEMASCVEFVREEIAIIRPRVIVALGGTAVAGLLGLDAPVGRLRGRFHDLDGTRVMVTYHPSYLLRKEEDGHITAMEEKRKVWEDMLLVMEETGMPINDKQRRYFLTK